MTTRAADKRSTRKLVILAIVVLILATLAWYVRNFASLDYLVMQESRLRNFIALNPWQAFFYGFIIYTLVALVPGTGGKAIVFGWLLGFWQALFIVTVGLTIAAMAIFSLSRYLFQASIERRYGAFLALMNQHIEKEGAFYLLTLRMAHAPYSIVNPVSGASRVRAWIFFWTTVVGLLPANAIWTYVGIRLPSLSELATLGANAFIDLPLLVALVTCAILPLLIRWLVGRFGIPATHEPSRRPTKEASP
ncbi:MAG: VTT domain-containing protein [Proteobacteria bacterium]|nr:VTT domain-containing protein [Pseudomonadota bacterium]